jgi:hypothetical protein
MQLFTRYPGPKFFVFAEFLSPLSRSLTMRSPAAADPVSDFDEAVDDWCDRSAKDERAWVVEMRPDGTWIDLTEKAAREASERYAARDVDLPGWLDDRLWEIGQALEAAE